MEFVLIWLVLAGGVAWLADSRGRSAGGFFLLSLILSPLVGLIAVLVTENRTVEALKDARRKEDHEQQLESIRAIAASAKPSSASASVGPAVSVADELIKLAQLRESGVLTEDEFQNQKRTLLLSGSKGLGMTA